MEIDLGAVERAVALVDDIIQAHVLQSLSQAVGGHLPVLVGPHGILRTGGKLHKILKAELAVNLVDQPGNALDLVLDLVVPHENVRVVLGKAAHPHQAVELSALLMAVHQSQLAHPQGQLPVGVGRILVHQHAAGAVHGLNREILLVDHRGVHIVLVVIPMPGILPQLAAQDNGRGNLLITLSQMDLPPIVDQRVFQGHALGQEERESRPLVREHKQSQLLAKLAVVALLGLLHHGQVLLQVRLIGECRAVNSGQHLVLLAASPVSPRDAGQLKGLHALGVHDMGACAQVRKLALSIKADGLLVRKILDQLHLVRLALFLHKLNGLVPGQHKGLHRKIFLDNLRHLPFQLLQILRGKSALAVKIIVKSVVNGRSDGQLGLRVQALHSLSQHMGGGVADRPQLVLRFLNASVR